MSSSKVVTFLFPHGARLQKKETLACPDCNIIMIAYKCEHVIIDKCANCNGIWLDDKEFGVFKRALDSHDLMSINEIRKPKNLT